MRMKNKKILRIFIFLSLFLFSVLSIIPALLIEQKSKYYETRGFIIDNLINDYKYIYIVIFIGLLISLTFFKTFFSNSYKEVKKIANKKLYDESNLKDDVPPVVWVSLIGAVVLMIIMGFIFVK